MFNYANYDYLVFDCDGVIIDSNRLKSQAFASALPGEPPELIQTFVEFHQHHGGISRYEKFRHYFQELKKSQDDGEKIRIALKRFASIVKKGMIECDYVPGVQEFLNQAKSRGISLFVVSGSDEDELKEVFRHRNILNLFNQVYGSPTNKSDNTGKVIEMMGLQKNGCFFGDSKSDYVAAKRYGINFIFVKDFTDWKEGIKTIGEKNIIANFLELMSKVVFEL